MTPHPRRRAACIAAILLLAAGVAGAQGIAGRVADTSSGAVAGALVRATHVASQRTLETRCGAAGEFQLGPLPPGPVRLLASAPGFSELSREYVLGEDGLRDIVLVLSPGALRQEISVAASRSERLPLELPERVTVATLPDIQARMPQSIVQAAERAPNVRVNDVNPLRNQPVIRGLRATRVLITVDGERLNNARFTTEGAGLSPSVLELGQIEAVEVVSGSASSLYGSDAIGGTLNLITRPPQPASAGQSLAFHLSGEGHTGNRFGRGGLSAFYSRPRLGLRVDLLGARAGNLRAGGGGTTLAGAVELGTFAQEIASSIRQNIAPGYAVYALEPGAEVNSSGGSIGVFGADLLLRLADAQTLRVRGSLNRSRDLGVPFTGPPFYTAGGVTTPSNFDRLSLRHEVQGKRAWFGRLSLGYFQQLREATDESQGYTIVPGSSFVTGAGGTSFTGRVSQFLKNSEVSTFSGNQNRGADVLAVLVPRGNIIWTTGGNYWRDEVRTRFSQDSFDLGGAVIARFRDVRSTADTDYQNAGWFHRVEWSMLPWLRWTGGFRLDRWTTWARPGEGFPSGNTLAVLNSALPALQANPGPVQVEGLREAGALAPGGTGLRTANLVATWNAGLVIPTRAGLIPYFRFGTSFRVPESTSLYLFRSFGASPTVSTISLPNTRLQPERGREFEGGVRWDGRRVRAGAGYFVNTLRDAITAVTTPVCGRPDPVAGLLPSPVAPCNASGTHLISATQSVNAAQARIQGLELSVDSSFRMLSLTVSPSLTFSTIRARNLRADVNRLAVVERFYGRGGDPLELRGSREDVPFGSMPDHQGVAALRAASGAGRWWAEYEVLWQSRIRRVDPNDLVRPVNTTYQLLRSFDPFARHALRAGARLDAASRWTVFGAVENIANRLYFLPAPAASPAAGRSFVLGLRANLGKAL